ncbi:MAG: hypothetical protein ACKEQI_00110 [Candidatus Hodgkinia cicadicola]
MLISIERGLIKNFLFLFLFLFSPSLAFWGGEGGWNEIEAPSAEVREESAWEGAKPRELSLNKLGREIGCCSEGTFVGEWREALCTREREGILSNRPVICVKGRERGTNVHGGLGFMERVWGLVWEGGSGCFREVERRDRTIGRVLMRRGTQAATHGPLGV